MRYLVALFVMFFTINSSVVGLDALDSFFRDTKKMMRQAKQLKKNARSFLENDDNNNDWDYKTNSSSYTHDRNTDQNGFKYSSNMAYIDKIFPKYRIKKIKLNPNGDKVVCLIEDRATRVIKIFSANNRNFWNQTVKESTPINNFELFGGNIVYDYKDKNGNTCVAAVNSKLERREVKVNTGVKSVRYIAGNNAVVVECYYGNSKYAVYRIDSHSCKQIAEPSQPVMSFFNLDLSAIEIVVKIDEDGRLNVYVPRKKKTKKKNSKDFWGSNEDYEENSVSFDSDEVEEDTQNLSLVKCIDNPDQERPISVDNEGNIWWVRIEHGHNQSAFIIEKVNPDTQSITKVFSIHGVSALDQVRISINSKGYPIFATFNGNKYQHFVINPEKNKSIGGHIDNINDKLKEHWYLVNTSSNDDRFWLICESISNAPEKFYIYDTRIGSLKRPDEIDNLSSNVNIGYIRQTSCQFIPVTGTKEKLQIFVTKGTFSGGNGLSSTDAPCVILLNSEEQYHRGYMPIAQLLANRGCNVVCLNYSKEIGHESLLGDSDSVDRFKSYLATAVNWCTRNNLAKHGNIVLLAKNHSCVPAFDIFAKNEKIFNCFIALSPDENDLNRIANHDLSDQISKPVVFIFNDHLDDDEIKSAQHIGSDCSILSLKNNGITQWLHAVIVPFFLRKRFDMVRTEKLSQKEIDKYIDITKDDLNIFEDTWNSVDSDDTRDNDHQSNKWENFNYLNG